MDIDGASGVLVYLSLDDVNLLRSTSKEMKSMIDTIEDTNLYWKNRIETHFGIDIFLLGVDWRSIYDGLMEHGEKYAVIATDNNDTNIFMLCERLYNLPYEILTECMANAIINNNLVIMEYCSNKFPSEYFQIKSKPVVYRNVQLATVMKFKEYKIKMFIIDILIGAIMRLDDKTAKYIIDNHDDDYEYDITSIFLEIVNRGRYELMEYFLSKSYRPYLINYALRRDNSYPLSYILKNYGYVGDINELFKDVHDFNSVRNLIDVGADFRYDNSRVLRHAAGNGNIYIVMYLHGLGADLRVHNDACLKFAVQNGYIEVVKYLLANGVPVDAATRYSLIEASKRGYESTVMYILFKADRQVNINLVFMAAIESGNISLLKSLVHKGAWVKWNNGAPMNLAIKLDDIDVISYLRTL